MAKTAKISACVSRSADRRQKRWNGDKQDPTAASAMVLHDRPPPCVSSALAKSPVGRTARITAIGKEGEIGEFGNKALRNCRAARPSAPHDGALEAAQPPTITTTKA